MAAFDGKRQKSLGIIMTQKSLLETQKSLLEWLAQSVATMECHILEVREFAVVCNIYASDPLLQTKHR